MPSDQFCVVRFLNRLRRVVSENTARLHFASSNVDTAETYKQRMIPGEAVVENYTNYPQVHARSVGSIPPCACSHHYLRSDIQQSFPIRVRHVAIGQVSGQPEARGGGLRCRVVMKKQIRGLQISVDDVLLRSTRIPATVQQMISDFLCAMPPTYVTQEMSQNVFGECFPTSPLYAVMKITCIAELHNEVDLGRRQAYVKNRYQVRRCIGQVLNNHRRR